MSKGQRLTYAYKWCPSASKCFLILSCSSLHINIAWQHLLINMVLRLTVLPVLWFMRKSVSV